MLQPKKSKYRKCFRGRMKGMASRGSKISFGEYGLKALTCNWVSARQIESARKAITRKLKRTGKVWVRLFPDKPYTMKSAEVPMGSGKGSIEGYVAVVKPGRLLFEIDGVTENLAREALRLAAHKLPIKTKFVTNND